MTEGAERPTIAKLDALWSQWQGRWKRLLSSHLIKELVLRASFDLEPVDPEDIARQIPLGAVPDCPSCDDVCCAGIENVVSLRLRDVAMLMDIGRTDLIRREKPRFSEGLLASRPHLQELVASELFQALPVLAQLGEERRCAALTPELRCGLHPNWPLSCERFPYSLVVFRKEVVWGRRCGSRKLDPSLIARSQEMFLASVDVYNERLKDAILLAHARPELDALGIGAFLTRPGQDPFEPKPDPPPRRSRLPIFGSGGAR